MLLIAVCTKPVLNPLDPAGIWIWIWFRTRATSHWGLEHLFNWPLTGPCGFNGPLTRGILKLNLRLSSVTLTCSGGGWRVCTVCVYVSMCVYACAQGDIYSANSSETSARWRHTSFRGFLSWELFQMWFVRIKGREEMICSARGGNKEAEKEKERGRGRKEKEKRRKMTERSCHITG